MGRRIRAITRRRAGSDPRALAERLRRTVREDAGEEQRLREPARRRAAQTATATVAVISGWQGGLEGRAPRAGGAEEATAAAGVRGVPVEAGDDCGQAAARAAGLRRREEPVPCIWWRRGCGKHRITIQGE